MSPSRPSSQITASKKVMPLRKQEGCSSMAARPSYNVKPGRRRHFRLTFTQLLPLLLLALLTLLGVSNARTITRRAGGSLVASDNLLAGGMGPRDEQRLPVLHARQDLLNASKSAEASASATSAAATTTKHHKSTSASAAASTAVSSAASSTHSASTPTDTTIPTVFDSGVSENFTATSCPKFFNSFIDSDDFNSCLPFSLLLQSSISFFEASASATSLSHVLDLTCKVVFTHCNALMASLAAQIKEPTNCGDDYALKNPEVLAAYNGFVSYEPMYKAGCLKASARGPSGSPSNASLTERSEKKSSEDQYCYVSAASASAESPADSYIYSLPLGVPLPGADRPTCSPCLQQTMGFFATAAQNLSSPLSTDYDAAALQVNQGCGPNWVNSSVTPIKGSADTSAATAQTVQLGTVVVSVVAAGWWLL